MGLLENKTALIIGVANDHSITWGIAQALHREGAQLAFSYFGEQLERRVRPLAESVGADLILPCDVTSDDQIDTMMEEVQARWGKIDILVHGAAFANRDELNGSFLKTTRAGFQLALDASAYSLIALIKAADARELLAPGASVLTLTYHGSTKVIPNYNVMGVAKAALEASVRYLAADLGPRGIRVNAISAGPIRTLAASGIKDFKTMHSQFKEIAPLRRNVTIEDVGNTALWLSSDLGSAVTGQIVYVDAGASIIGAATAE
jgi:enoyl-[acyl-carrier protein] reductase I